MERVVRDIPLGNVIGPLEPVRGSIDMEKVRELAESMRGEGQLQDALVRPQDGKYEIVWGDRRYLALKLISSPTIRAEIRDLTDEETIILRATENLQREDLTPMEQARIYGVFHNRLKYPIEKISRVMGKNRNTVARYLDLLDLPEEFQGFIDAGKISVSVAEILLHIDNEELRRYYLTNAADGGCSAKTAQLWVSDYEATKAAQYYMSPTGDGSMALAPEMKPIYYACDLCTEPVELSKARHVLACPICVGKMRSRSPYKGE